jgi:hypothetical protein
MIQLPVINAPNQEVLLDLSKIQSGNYAESEIQVVTQGSGTILILPKAESISGYPFIYVVGGNFKVKCQDGDVFLFPNGDSSETIEGNALVIIKKAVVVPESVTAPFYGIYAVVFGATF